MLGYGEIVYARADTLGIHRIKETVPVNRTARWIDANRIQVIAMAGVGFEWSRRGNGKVSEGFVIAYPDLLATQPMLLDLGQLMQPNRRLHIHHVVFEPALHHLVVLVSSVTKAMPGILAHTVQCQDPRPRDLFLVPPQDHPALPRHHVLGDVEAEAAEIAEASGGRAGG